MITLVNFLEAVNISINRSDYKFHLAMPSENSSPILEYHNGTFEKYQALQNKRNFQCEHIISLITLSENRWLFVGVFKVLGIEPRDENKFKYTSELLKDQDDLIGRIIIEYKRTSRSSYRIGRTIEDQCLISEVLPKKLTIGQYPGNNEVCISYHDLNLIFSQNEPTWFGALSSIKGIYLITDTKNGKKYVGKADGKDGIWQRWKQYSKNGHGDNTELKAVLYDKGIDYKSNFQFTLIEIADFQTPDLKINEREIFWKKAFRSKDFGYNGN
ncbi:MAG: GIY-YIG nuclease family protein [Flavobacteriaceae bacterium]|nr:GIY-YIG nuclease family protein [Flavobacteriaceae bacterium]